MLPFLSYMVWLKDTVNANINAIKNDFALIRSSLSFKNLNLSRIWLPNYWGRKINNTQDSYDCFIWTNEILFLLFLLYFYFIFIFRQLDINYFDIDNLVII